MGSLLSAAFFCEQCQKETKFLPIHFALQITRVSESTVFHWMKRGWVHWRPVAGGNRLVCQDSLGDQNRFVAFEKQLAAADLDFRVRLVLDDATSNLTRDLSLPELAATGNVCVWHMCRLFKVGLGISPKRCIKLLRLRAAADLLATTALTVKEVMVRVGLSDESHFVRDFENAAGESPLQYRRRIRTPSDGPVD
jgi:transcriptional regulator GlxA family with amidase domain